MSRPASTDDLGEVDPGVLQLRARHAGDEDNVDSLHQVSVVLRSWQMSAVVTS